ncbi:MAG: hypothetical protein EOO74_11540 [Myxococcales bacterium]|nr:MAG: hypothetical protein EOO74_11540 [Myxococcales bacterium]
MKYPIGRNGALNFSSTATIRVFDQAWPNGSRAVLDLVATFVTATGVRRISRTYRVERIGSLTVTEVGTADDPLASAVPGAAAALLLGDATLALDLTPGAAGTGVVWEIAGHFLSTATS